MTPAALALTLQPFWVSWYQHPEIAFTWEGPWWISGVRADDGADMICAAVMATSEDDAKARIVAAHDKPVEIEWRFVSPRPADWSPFGDRFRRVDWMKWPWPAGWGRGRAERTGPNKGETTMKDFKIALGTKVKDKVTAYGGIVIARTEWLYGCIRYTVQSQEMKDGKPVDAMAFDEDALEVVEDAKPEPIKSRGGPKDDPRPRSAETR